MFFFLLFYNLEYIYIYIYNLKIEKNLRKKKHKIMSKNDTLELILEVLQLIPFIYVLVLVLYEKL